MGFFLEMASQKFRSCFLIHSLSLTIRLMALSTSQLRCMMDLEYFCFSVTSFSFSSFLPVLNSSLMLPITFSISQISPKLQWLNCSFSYLFLAYSKPTSLSFSSILACRPALTSKLFLQLSCTSALRSSECIFMSCSAFQYSQQQELYLVHVASRILEQNRCADSYLASLVCSASFLSCSQSWCSMIVMACCRFFSRAAAQFSCMFLMASSVLYPRFSDFFIQKVSQCLRRYILLSSQSCLIPSISLSVLAQCSDDLSLFCASLTLFFMSMLISFSRSCMNFKRSVSYLMYSRFSSRWLSSQQRWIQVFWAICSQKIIFSLTWEVMALEFLISCSMRWFFSKQSLSSVLSLVRQCFCCSADVWTGFMASREILVRERRLRVQLMLWSRMPILRLSVRQDQTLLLMVDLRSMISRFLTCVFLRLSEVAQDQFSRISSSGSSRARYRCEDFLVKKLSYLLRFTFSCGSEVDFANNIYHLLNLLCTQLNFHQFGRTGPAKVEAGRMVGFWDGEMRVILIVFCKNVEAFAIKNVDLWWIRNEAMWKVLSTPSLSIMLTHSKCLPFLPYYLCKNALLRLFTTCSRPQTIFPIKSRPYFARLSLFSLFATLFNTTSCKNKILKA